MLTNHYSLNPEEMIGETTISVNKRICVKNFLKLSDMDIKKIKQKQTQMLDEKLGTTIKNKEIVKKI